MGETRNGQPHLALVDWVIYLHLSNLLRLMACVIAVEGETKYQSSGRRFNLIVVTRRRASTPVDKIQEYLVRSKTQLLELYFNISLYDYEEFDRDHGQLFVQSVKIAVVQQNYNVVWC